MSDRERDGIEKARINDARLRDILIYCESDERQGYPVPLAEFKLLMLDLRDARAAHEQTKRDYAFAFDAEQTRTRERDDALVRCDDLAAKLALVSEALSKLLSHPSNESGDAYWDADNRWYLTPLQWAERKARAALAAMEDEEK